MGFLSNSIKIFQILLILQIPLLIVAREASPRPNVGQGQAVETLANTGKTKSKTEDHSTTPTPEDDIHDTHQNLNFTIKSIRKVIPSNTNYTGRTPSSALSPEDQKIRNDWGGNCTAAHWNKCSREEYFYGKYEDDEGKTRDDPTGMKRMKCKYLPYWCHNNGWTINFCHIMCMSKCSRELLTRLDRFMKHEGECSYL